MAERNMDMNKCPMPVQDPDVRNKNFDEVALGYTYDMAVNEARRCLNCKNKPCVSACPVQINIPAFIERVANEDIEGAFAILSESTSLPAVCGRVCPQENQCEGKCVRGIKGEPVGIGRLERFVADYHREHCTDAPVKPEPNGHKVAVIGAGPSGLTVAGDLAKLGYKVTIFEALHLAGGVLVYGIPEFRLPKAIVQKEIDNLKAIGVDVETNMVIGKVLTIDEIFEMGNEAIFVGSGAGLPRFMNIPGESLKGVYSANEFLTRINLMKAYRDGSKTPIQHAKKVAVVGGGNVAMDAARSAAEEYAGTTAVDSVTAEVDPELDESPAHYEVELQTAWGEFEYLVDAYTGKVLSGQKDLLAAVSASNETTKPSGQKPAPSGTVQDIGYAKAKSIALNHAGLSENQAYDMDIELDDEDGKLVYEIEFKSGGMEYSYEINAATGAILKHETELDD